MKAAEIDSFIGKFYQLWRSGHTAHLDIDTCAGKAWMGLHLQMEHIPGPPHQPYQQRAYSASYQHRCERREHCEAARAAACNAEKASEPSTNCEKLNIPVKEFEESVKEMDENGKLMKV